VQSAESGFASWCRFLLLRSLGVSVRRKVRIAAIAAGLALTAVISSIFSTELAGAQELSCDQSQSVQEVRKLTDARTIVSVDVFLPNVTVVVEDRAWQRTSTDEKKTIAHNIDCATAGPNNKMLRAIYFRSNKTNKELAQFSQNELTIE
jgi:hypothetical protein